MNKGVISANGAILGVLNVDDCYFPGALKTAIELLGDATAPAFLWGTCQVRSPTGVELQHPGRFDLSALLLGWEIHPWPINPCSYFYHRSLHLSAGLFDETDHYTFDVDFLFRASIHAVEVIRVPAVLGERNQSAARISAIHARYFLLLSTREKAVVECTLLSRQALGAAYTRWPRLHGLRMRLKAHPNDP
jgi:hypothetical protein